MLVRDLQAHWFARLVISTAVANSKVILTVEEQDRVHLLAIIAFPLLVQNRRGSAAYEQHKCTSVALQTNKLAADGTPFPTWNCLFATEAHPIDQLG